MFDGVTLKIKRVPFFLGHSVVRNIRENIEIRNLEAFLKPFLQSRRTGRGFHILKGFFQTIQQFPGCAKMFIIQSS